MGQGGKKQGWEQAYDVDLKGKHTWDNVIDYVTKLIDSTKVLTDNKITLKTERSGVRSLVAGTARGECKFDHSRKPNDMLWCSHYTKPCGCAFGGIPRLVTRTQPLRRRLRTRRRVARRRCGGRTARPPLHRRPLRGLAAG